MQGLRYVPPRPLGLSRTFATVLSGHAGGAQLTLAEPRSPAWTLTLDHAGAGGQARFAGELDRTRHGRARQRENKDPTSPRPKPPTMRT
jgi:hypothetical protein